MIGLVDYEDSDEESTEITSEHSKVLSNKCESPCIKNETPVPKSNQGTDDILNLFGIPPLISVPIDPEVTFNINNIIKNNKTENLSEKIKKMKEFGNPKVTIITIYNLLQFCKYFMNYNYRFYKI